MFRMSCSPSCPAFWRDRSSPARRAVGRDTDFVEALRAGATLAQDPSGTEPITRDPKDDYLVRLARASGADVLVSGDSDLLEAEVDDVDILTPRAFIDRLEEEA